MKRYLIRFVLGGVILLALLGHAARIYQIPLISHLDAIFYDAKIRFTMPNSVDDRVVILDIDEQSLAEVGRWPWGRDKLATMMDQLFKRYKVSIVGFDVVFAEPDESSGLKSLEKLARQNPSFQPAVRSLRPQLDYDARFAQSLKGRPVVLGYYMSSEADAHISGVLPEPVWPAGGFLGGADVLSWNGYGANLPELQKAAAAAGHFNPMVDFDGISRRVPLVVEYQGAYYEALSLAMVRRLLGNPPVMPGYPADADPRDYGSLEWLELSAVRGSLRIPVDENAATLVPYRGYERSFHYLHAADVLAGRVPVEQLTGKIVLVGTTAPGLKDLRVTPVGTAYPGVEIHANLIAGMLDGSIKYKPSYVLAVDLMQIFVAGLVMVFLLPLLPPLRATLVSLVVLSSLIGLNLYLWSASHLVIPAATALIMVGLLYALNMSWGYFVESRTKRQFTDLFGQYVPPELVEEMAKNPEGYSMEGRKAELTVLFSDVRGFTTISEGLAPDQLAALMNEYLGAMTQVIRGHRGTLDKYIGDAIMAFWGAPVTDADHALQAVITALDMQVGMARLNQDLITRGWPELKIGIGVNTGVMTVGDMGSPVRKAYTVMGDAVNLGSRLEGITKQYGVGIVVGEATYALVKERFVFRELDRVRVKGKDEPVAIYEPIGEVGKVPAGVLEEIKRWDEALLDYRQQKWDQAEAALKALSADSPHYLYELYLKRIAHCRENPPGEGWDGVTTFETK